MKRANLKIAKYWWVFVIIAFATIYLAAPNIFDVQFSVHGSQWKPGMCHVGSDTCIIACGTNSFGTYSCVTARETECSIDADCSKVIKFTDSQRWNEEGYKAVLDRYYQETIKENPADVKGIFSDAGDLKSCIDGNIVEGEIVSETCDYGCKVKAGVPECNKFFEGFLKMEVYSVPVWLIIVALMFLLLIVGMGRR